MKNILKAYKIIKSKKRSILEYGLYKKGVIQMTNLDTTIEIEMNIQAADNLLIHIPTLERCQKLDFQALQYKEGELIDIETGVSVKMPSDYTVDEFPEMKDHFDSHKEKTVLTPLNYQDVLTVSKSISFKRSSYVINSIAVFKNGSMASTDGRRMHIVGNIDDDDNPTMIPPSIIKLSNLFKIEGSLQTNEKHDIAILTGDFGRIIFKTLSGKYPNIKEVIPKNSQPLKIDAKNLLSVLKKIKKAFSPGDPEAFHLNGFLNWNDTKFPLELPEGLNHRFNFHYMIDALEAIDPEFLELPEDNTRSVKIQNGSKMAVLTPITYRE